MPDRVELGYDAVAAEYIVARSRTIGVAAVLEWAQALAPGAAVLDLGCGHGEPIAAALVRAGFAVYGVDASPRLVEEFRARLPGVPVVCEAIEGSGLHGRSFDGVVAWGLIFLLDEVGQRRVIEAARRVLVPGGRLIFTAPWQAGVWQDVVTGREARSIGREGYRRLVEAVGMEMVGEGVDDGGSQYFCAVRG